MKLLKIFIFWCVFAWKTSAQTPPKLPARQWDYNLNMVHHNPGEAPFVTKYNDPAYLKQEGFNGQVPRVFVPCAITYPELDEHTSSKDLALRQTIDRYASKLDTVFQNAKNAGIAVYPFTDLMILPKTIAEKYRSEIGRDGVESGMEVLGGTKLNATILKKRTQLLLRQQINAIFERFPTIDGLVARFGETYLHEFPDYAGGSPAKTPDELTVLINLLREEICVKRNKKLFFRTWDFAGFHTRPDYYLQVTNAIEPHPNLIFSIKHIQADYLRLYPFNPCLGIGKHRQIVEISCNPAGAYGKNAHPYYIGQGILDGWTEQAWVNLRPKCLNDLRQSPLVVGVWTWARGDGWAGPYTPNELWVDLNVHIFNQFFQQPGIPEIELFNKVASEKLGVAKHDLAAFRELCLLSAEATLRGQATLYAHVSDWWCRDEFIAAVDLKAVVRSGKSAEVRQEKAQAVQQWKQIEALARKIHLPDKSNQEFLEVSCTYGRIKYELFEQVWNMQLLAAEASSLKQGIDAKAMKAAIDRYDQLWLEWKQLKAQSAACPTLYRDDEAQYCFLPPFRTALDQYRTAAGRRD